jgi:hypothetical protein
LILLTALALEAMDMFEVAVIFFGKAFQRLLLQIFRPQSAKVAVRSREIAQRRSINEQGDGQLELCWKIGETYSTMSHSASLSLTKFVYAAVLRVNFWIGYIPK